MTKRGFMESLFGGALISLPEVGKVEVLKLEERDTVVVTYGGHLSDDAREYVAREFKKQFPNNEVLILADGLDLKVLKG